MKHKVENIFLYVNMCFAFELFVNIFVLKKTKDTKKLNNQRLSIPYGPTFPPVA